MILVLDLKNETLSVVPLSLIYKQIIRLMKENGIYATYLELSYPEVKMDYDKFLICVKRFRGNAIRHFFTHRCSIGKEFDACYSGISKLKKYDCSYDFLYDKNIKLQAYLNGFTKNYGRIEP